MDKETLASLFTAGQLAPHAQALAQNGAVQEAAPIAVDHRAPPTLRRVNFTIRGVADFGPEASAGKDSAGIRTAIVDAIQAPPEQGQLYWLPSVYFEVTEAWDEEGTYAPTETQQDHAPAERGGDVIDALAHYIATLGSDLTDRLDGIERSFASDIVRLGRDIDNERAARLLESAARRDPHQGGGLPRVHDGGGGGDVAGAGAGDGSAGGAAGGTSDHGGDAGAQPDGGHVDRLPRRGRHRTGASGATGPTPLHPGAEDAGPEPGETP